MNKCDNPVIFTHYHLVCKTCNVELLPVIATVAGELLYQTVQNETCDCCNDTTKEAWGVDKVRKFHNQHTGHELEERECTKS